jgi:hypothetical protein
LNVVQNLVFEAFIAVTGISIQDKKALLGGQVPILETWDCHELK